MTTTTTNYGFVKPDVGASDDAWGGMLNTDLDGIDAAIKTVSNTAPGDNRIINGDMRIDQRNNGVSGAASNVYTVDRWEYFASQAAKGNWGRNTATPPPGFPYWLGFGSTSAYAVTASDYFMFGQAIEADAISDFAWGAAGAQSVTLSFWALSSIAGTFSGALQNYAQTRSYPFSFTLLASTWTKIAITIPGDTGGTWVKSGNGGALFVYFSLGAGATYSGPANAWASAIYFGATGAANVVATNGASFGVTGVKLEIGSVATPYPRQSLAKSMADCQRYFIAYTSQSLGVNFNATWGPGDMVPSDHARGSDGTEWFFHQRHIRRYWAYSEWRDTFEFSEFMGGDGRHYTHHHDRSIQHGALTMTYSLTADPNTVIRDEDGVQSFIPMDPDNVDCQAYFAWLDKGNKPTPYIPPPAAEEASSG